MTAYPNSSDYVMALQDPGRAFRDPALQRADFARHPTWRTPLALSGNAAVVFRAAVEGRTQALRFFIREDVAEKRRYAALDDHFVKHRMQDWVSRASWVDDAIAVNGRRWPMVQMDWIDGERLDDHVRGLTRNNPGALPELANAWRARVRQVQQAQFAHGDLQHGNVLVEPSGALRLVDFDGSWIAAIGDLPEPNEHGNPNYQHKPHRTWGRWMDTFPALVIYTGLLALSRRPDAWRDNEGILFTRKDLTQPGGTPTWELLAEIRDPETERAVQRLRATCRPDWEPDVDLERLLEPLPVTVRHQGGGSHAAVFPGVTGRFVEPSAQTRPTDAAQRGAFGGVHGPPPLTPPGVSPKTTPTPPATPPAKSPAAARTRTARVVFVAAMIAVLLALLLVVIVATNGG